MRTGLFLFLLCSIFCLGGLASTAQAATPGYIYLQVEQRGQAWYFSPLDSFRYSLGTPEEALVVMKRLSLGVKHELLENTVIFPARLHGLILLDVEAHGEAYYINPKDGTKQYLSKPTDALNVMRQLSVGISDTNLAKIPVGDLGAVALTETIDLQVPFTSQAPFGRWSDPRQADGCEEASAFMAVMWARGEAITPEKAEQAIIGMSIYQQSRNGEYRDSSTADTLQLLIKDYMKHEAAELKTDVAFSDMISALRDNKVIVAAINGLAVGNVYYRSPGPPHHMIVIVGYDPVKKVFLAHDPAARAHYEYPAATLYNALRDYPTGYRERITELRKNIIVVSK